MKDHVTALMEALRLIQLETDRHRRRGRNAPEALRAIEAIMTEPSVSAAMRSLEPFVPSPGLVPTIEDVFADHEA